MNKDIDDLLECIRSVKSDLLIMVDDCLPGDSYLVEVENEPHSFAFEYNNGETFGISYYFDTGDDRDFGTYRFRYIDDFNSAKDNFINLIKNKVVQ
jgi:hypothetical protein